MIVERNEQLIFKYNFKDGIELKLIDSGLSLGEIWKLEELHGKILLDVDGKRDKYETD